MGGRHRAGSAAKGAPAHPIPEEDRRSSGRRNVGNEKILWSQTGQPPPFEIVTRFPQPPGGGVSTLLDLVPLWTTCPPPRLGALAHEQP